jgi:thiol-disulfide isomerase/thioredoxin
MIGALTLAARLVLAMVFSVAGAAKLRDRAGTREAAVGFGTPEALAGPVAELLPLAELAIAGLLLFAGTAAAGTIVALALLSLFSAAMAVSLARGRTPDCHCFGQLHSAPTSWRTLVRNGILTAVAALALAGTLAEPGRSAVAWIGRLEPAEILALTVGAVALVLLAVGGGAFVSLLRSYGKVLVRLERVEQALAAAGIEVESDELREVGLAPGTPAPAREQLAPLLERGLPVLLLFTSPRCGPCRALLPRAAAWQADHGDRLTVAFATEGAEEEALAEAAELELEHVLVDRELALYQAFEANGTPSAVLISAHGTIASWVASGADAIERLVATAVEPKPGLPVGSELPELELPSLDGEPVSLAELAGRDTLLLFWNPACGFCRAMHEELAAWERSTNGNGPRLVVVSSGDEENTRADGFRSQVLLDGDFAAGSLFGADGTPMAVLVGVDGRVASPLVAGAEAVMSLARGAGS